MKGGIFIPIDDFIIHILNIDKDDIENLKTSINGDEVIYEIKLKRKEMYCDYCHEKMIGHGVKKRKISHPNIRGYDGTIYHIANRYICKYCHKTKLENNPFTFNRFNNSYSKIKEVMKYLKNLNYTLDMISKELNISSTHINNYIDSYIVVPKLRLPEWLGIDEIHSDSLTYKNASYLCVMVDGEKRRLFDILGSRSKDTLSNYFSKIDKEERLNVRYVTIDMWETYKDLAIRYFPNCIVAIDPFHYIKHLCDGFERLRINLMNQCEYGSPAYYLLKKWNYLFTKDDIDLDNGKTYNRVFNEELNRRDIFNIMADNFPLLYEAYLLKEEFRDMVKTCSYHESKAKYDDLYMKFKNSGIREYDDFVQILGKWKDEILNSFLRPYDKHKLSNALTENINGKLNQYVIISKGLTNFKRFRKRVLYALNSSAYFSISDKLRSDKYTRPKRGPYNKTKQ